MRAVADDGLFTDNTRDEIDIKWGNTQDAAQVHDRMIQLIEDNIRLMRRSDAVNDGPGPALATRENTLPNIIGALLKLFLDTDDKGNKLSPFKAQADIITALIERYSHKPGISESNLKKMFAEANKSLRACLETKLLIL